MCESGCDPVRISMFIPGCLLKCINQWVCHWQYLIQSDADAVLSGCPGPVSRWLCEGLQAVKDARLHFICQRHCLEEMLRFCQCNCLRPPIPHFGRANHVEQYWVFFARTVAWSAVGEAVPVGPFQASRTTAHCGCPTPIYLVTNFAVQHAPSFWPVHAPSFRPVHAPSFRHVHAPSFRPVHVPSFRPAHGKSLGSKVRAALWL